MGDNLKQHNPNFIVLQSGIEVWLWVIWSNLCTVAQSLRIDNWKKKKGAWLEFPSFTYEFRTTYWDGYNLLIGPLQALLAPSEILASSWWGNTFTVIISLNIQLWPVSPLNFCCLTEVSLITSHKPFPTINKFLAW